MTTTADHRLNELGLIRMLLTNGKGYKEWGKNKDWKEMLVEKIN